MDGNIEEQIKQVKLKLAGMDRAAGILKAEIYAARAASKQLQQLTSHITDDNPVFLFYRSYFQLVSRTIEERGYLLRQIYSKQKANKLFFKTLANVYANHSQKRTTLKRTISEVRARFDDTELTLIGALRINYMKPSEQNRSLICYLYENHVRLDYQLGQLDNQLRAYEALCFEQYEYLDEQFRGLMTELDKASTYFCATVTCGEQFAALGIQIKAIESLANSFNTELEVAKYFQQRTGIQISKYDVSEQQSAEAEIGNAADQITLQAEELQQAVEIEPQ